MVFGVLQASLLQLPSVMSLVSLLDEPDPELLWMVRPRGAGMDAWQGQVQPLCLDMSAI